MEVNDYLMQFYETFEQQRHFNTVGEQLLTLTLLTKIANLTLCKMHKRLASEMACFAICHLGWTTPLINDWATIFLYADKGDLSFREKKSSLCCTLCILKMYKFKGRIAV